MEFITETLKSLESLEFLDPLKSVAILATGVSTMLLTVIAIIRMICSGIVKLRQAILDWRMGRTPRKRVEVINVDNLPDNIMNISVRNRSKIPVSLVNPIFEFKGHRGSPTDAAKEDMQLNPGDTAAFLMRFPKNINSTSRRKYALVDTGHTDQA